jgi:hypothetical protein
LPSLTGRAAGARPMVLSAFAGAAFGAGAGAALDLRLRPVRSPSAKRCSAIRYESNPYPLTCAAQTSLMTDLRRQDSRRRMSVRWTSRVGLPTAASASRST